MFFSDRATITNSQRPFYIRICIFLEINFLYTTPYSSVNAVVIMSPVINFFASKKSKNQLEKCPFYVDMHFFVIISWEGITKNRDKKEVKKLTCQGFSLKQSIKTEYKSVPIE